MKNLLTSLFFVTAAVAAVGCKEKEAYLRTIPDSVEIAADSLEFPVDVEASASWMTEMTPPATWIEGYRYDGSVLWVTLADENRSLTERSTGIRIVSGDGLSVTVPVLQRAMEAVFDIVPNSLEPFDGWDPETQTITVHASGIEDWNFSVGEDWLSVARGEDARGNILTVTARRSQDPVPRVGRLIVFPVEEAFSSLADTITVVKNEVDLVVVSDDYTDPETFDINLPVEGGEATLTVVARSEWSVKIDQPQDGRVTLDATGGAGDPDNGVPLVVFVPENTSEEEYDFSLTFTCEGKNYKYKCSQAGKPATGGDE